MNHAPTASPKRWIAGILLATQALSACASWRCPTPDDFPICTQAVQKAQLQGDRLVLWAALRPHPAGDTIDSPAVVPVGPPPLQWFTLDLSALPWRPLKKGSSIQWSKDQSRPTVPRADGDAAMPGVIAQDILVQTPSFLQPGERQKYTLEQQVKLLRKSLPPEALLSVVNSRGGEFYLVRRNPENPPQLQVVPVSAACHPPRSGRRIDKEYEDNPALGYIHIARGCFPELEKRARQEQEEKARQQPVR